MVHAKSEYDLFDQWISIPRILEYYCLDEIEGCSYQDPLYIYHVGLDLGKGCDYQASSNIKKPIDLRFSTESKW
jgi:hypothetical protein